MKKLVQSIVFALGITLACPSSVLAVKIDKPEWYAYTDVGVLLRNIIIFILIVAALIFFFMLVIGGVQWMLSGGDKAGTDAARHRITAALIGLLVVFAAWAIAKLIETFLGISFLGTELPIPRP